MGLLLPIQTQLALTDELYHRKNLHLVDILQRLRSRVGFFSLINLFDSLEDAKLDKKQQSQNYEMLAHRIQH